MNANNASKKAGSLFRNPEGIPSFSPGLRVCKLPWFRRTKIFNPARVASSGARFDATLAGLMNNIGPSQGRRWRSNPGLQDCNPVGIAGHGDSTSLGLILPILNSALSHPPPKTCDSLSMNPPATNWVAIVYKSGKRISTCKLVEGTTTIGRTPTSQIQLPNSSVTREQAEILCRPDGITLRDLGSRNGVLVNGVPRKKALLQPGDKLAICDFVIELTTAAPAESPTLGREPGLAAVLQLEQTIDLRPRLPEPRSDRQLATLYHICFWIAEGLEEKIFTERCLNLLLESLRAREVHFFSADPELKAVVTEDRGKPAVKLAAFLAKQFQEAGEARAFPGQEVARHQRGVGDFNYLVCPICPSAPAPAPSPFVVVLRATEQQDFTADDRVLLQAICQLWARGQARTFELSELRQQNAQLKEKLPGAVLVGSSAVLKKLQEQSRKLAAPNATVLITGETGSGKEVLAQFIHENSARRNSPLVKMNCAAIPDSLIESELFGYAKGAFSGATRDHNGKFVQANGGTLFLDEVGEMPLQVQAKVLRAV